ncbi:MAG: hypothetical protein ACT4QE_23990 [Anaerolineales bacterium]
MTHTNWRTLAEFDAPKNVPLTDRLFEAVQELALPEAFLKRLGSTVMTAAEAARQREPEAAVTVGLLVANGQPVDEPYQCWGCFRLERVVEQPIRHTEIQVFLFLEQ